MARPTRGEQIAKTKRLQKEAREKGEIYEIPEKKGRNKKKKVEKKEKKEIIPPRNRQEAIFKFAECGLPLVMTRNIMKLKEEELKEKLEDNLTVEEHYQNKYEMMIAFHLENYLFGDNKPSKYIIDLAILKQYDASLKKSKVADSDKDKNKVSMPFTT